MSSSKSEQSSLEKITTDDLPQKSEVTAPPVDMSSQASIEEVEGSLEDIPANISPIAAIYSSGSARPPVDPSELEANANRAIDNMLHLKRSLDVKRQRATWELGVLLHQNESQGAASIATAKAVYSQAVLEAKTNFQVTVMEAKTTRCCSIQAAEVACSKAISDTEAWKTSQVMMFQEEHSKYLQSLEEQAFREESRSRHEVLSSCQAALCHSPQLLRGALAASYHLLLGQAPPSPPLILPPRTPPQKNSHLQLLPCANTQTVSKTKKVASFARANGEHPPGQSHPGSCIRGTSQPQEVREPSLVQVAEAQPC